METAVVTKFGKGRPRKVEGDEGLSIKDPLLGNYYIKITEHQYEVLQPSPIAKDKTIGYYGTLGGALFKIAKLQINTQPGRKSVYLLREYIDEYKEVINKLNNQFL